MNEQMIAEALLLQDAILNKESRVVNYLLSKARNLAIRATAELIGIEPTDTQSIISLQGQATRYADMIVWIRNAMEDATMAQAELSAEEADLIERELWGSQDD